VVLTAFCAGLVVIMLGMGVYVAQWYLNLGRIRAEGARYAQMYGGRGSAPEAQSDANVVTPPSSAEPTAALSMAATPTPVPSSVPTATPVPTERPTPAPTSMPAIGPDAGMPVAVDEPIPVEATAEVAARAESAPTQPPAVQGADMPVAVDVPIPAEATAGSTAVPEPTSTPAVTVSQAEASAVGPDSDMPVPVDEPIPTPDSDTLVIALPTAPPVQDSFRTLLAANPDTVGFLEIEEMLSLPVVQRPNDNEYYLDHSFEGAKALEGTLFLDGMNRLVPEDDCLIVYGHNMKNHTMFGRLSAYGDVGHLRQHPVVYFDTLYENRSYVAFAAFSASMAQGDSRYFDVRNFIFDEDSFDKFVLKLQSRSVFKSPVDVRYGDGLLLLVTCDYSNREGRFILALRQLRPDENEGNMFALMLQAEMKQ
jgi:sortase B